MNNYHVLAHSRISATAIFIVTAMLAACGGGGGGSETNTPSSNDPGSNTPGTSAESFYTGVTTASTLGAANTPVIAAGLLYELGLSNGDRPYSAQAGASGSLHSVTARASKTQQSKRAWFAKTVTTEDCPGGGTLHTDDNTTANGTGTITLTHTACIDESGVRSDGILSMQIVAYDLAQDQPTDVTFTFQEYTQRDGTDEMGIDGTLHVVLANNTSTATYNVVVRYLPEGVQHWMQNLVVQQQLLPSNVVQVTVQGRFFHSAHGYVDVETAVPLTVDMYSGLAALGTLRLQNSAPPVAELRFTATDQLVLALDENADGVPERTLRAYGLAGLTATNHLPAADAGPDLTTVEGQTVTLQGTASDWDGDAFTYEWWCESAPGAAHS